MEDFYKIRNETGVTALIGREFQMPVHVSYARLTDSRFLSIGLKKAPDQFSSSKDEEILLRAALQEGGRKDATLLLQLSRVTTTGTRLWSVVDMAAALHELSAEKTAEIESAEAAIQAARRAEYAAYDAAKLSAQQKIADDIVAEKQAALKAARDAESDAMARDGSQWLPDAAYFGYVYPQGQSYGAQILKLIKGAV